MSVGPDGGSQSPRSYVVRATRTETNAKIIASQLGGGGARGRDSLNMFVIAMLTDKADLISWVTLVQIAALLAPLDVTCARYDRRGSSTSSTPNREAFKCVVSLLITANQF
jgi:hypothetical protein